MFPPSDTFLTIDGLRLHLRDWGGPDAPPALLLVHGVLHLLGYEDETEAGAETMREIEKRLLGKPLDKVEPDVDRTQAPAAALPPPPPSVHLPDGSRFSLGSYLSFV